MLLAHAGWWTDGNSLALSATIQPFPIPSAAQMMSS
jgi:hypothetical protein